MAKVYNCTCPILYSGHEIDPVARHFILNSDHCPKHLFGDIGEQFQPSVIEQMQYCCSVMQKRAEKAAEAGGENETSKKKVMDSISKRCVMKLLAIAKAAIADGRVNTSGWCYVHDGECEFWPTLSEGDKVLEAGGNSCVAFSQQGTHGRWLHRSAIVTALWLAKTRARQVDFVLQECSSLFNTQEAFHEAFGEGFKTIVLKVKCEDLGVPMVRWRNYSWTINTTTMDLQRHFTRQDFLDVAKHPIDVDGHAFFLAPEDMVQEHLRRKLLHQKGIPVAPGDKVAMDAALDVGSKLHLQD